MKRTRECAHSISRRDERRDNSSGIEDEGYENNPAVRALERRKKREGTKKKRGGDVSIFTTGCLSRRLVTRRGSGFDFIGPVHLDGNISSFTTASPLPTRRHRRPSSEISPDANEPSRPSRNRDKNTCENNLRARLASVPLVRNKSVNIREKRYGNRESAKNLIFYFLFQRATRFTTVR